MHESDVVMPAWIEAHNTSKPPVSPPPSLSHQPPHFALIQGYFLTSYPYLMPSLKTTLPFFCTIYYLTLSIQRAYIIYEADLQSHESMVTRGKLKLINGKRRNSYDVPTVRELTVSTLGNVDSWVMAGFKTVGAIG